MSADRELPVMSPVVVQLQAAAPAAVCAVANERVEAGRDPNPYTQQLTAYDLGRLFTLDPTGTTRDGVADLDDIATVIHGTPPPSQRRRPRALWVAHELTRLGYPNEAARFTALAVEQPVSF